MPRIFDSILAKRPVRNWFPLGRDVKLSLDIGKLVPVMCEPVVPTDEGTIQTQSFVRFAPMLHPVLAQFNVRFDYFYVPMCRLYDYNLYNRIVTGGVKGNLDIPRFGCTFGDLMKVLLDIIPLDPKASEAGYVYNDDFLSEFFGDTILTKPVFFNLLLADGYQEHINSLQISGDSEMSYLSVVRWLYNHLFASSSIGDYLGLPTPTYEHNGVELPCFPGYFKFDENFQDLVVIGGYKDDNYQMLYEFYKFIYGLKDYWINLEPFLAYQAIFADYYRDQNLDTAEFLPVKDSFSEDKSQQFDDYLLRLKEMYGADVVDHDTGITTSINLFELRNRAYPKDYFTSALPSAQRGPQANLKLDVEGTATLDSQNVLIGAPTVTGYDDNGTLVDRRLVVQGDETQVQIGKPDQNFTPYPFAETRDQRVQSLHGRLQSASAHVSGLFANLTAQALRAVVKLQEQLELLSTAGGRATEQIYAIFGKRPSDIMNKRVQYLGGSKSPVQITAVLSDAETTSDEGTVPLGAMAGQGVNSDTSPKIHFSCPDYGFIICLMSVMPKPSYYQGIPRKFLQIDRFDFFLPKFEHLGEQAILNSELYAQHNNPKGTFGYTPRYAEYKSSQDEIHGQFRTSLRDWHAARTFCGTNPALTASFIQAHQGDVSRIFTIVEDPATEDGKEGTQHVYVELYHDLNMIRPMSLYSTPSF